MTETERRHDYSDFAQQLGHLTGVVEGMQKTLDQHTIAEQKITEDIYTRLTKAEITLGKIGVAFTVTVFVVSFAVNFLSDWVKHLWSGQ